MLSGWNYVYTSGSLLDHVSVLQFYKHCDFRDLFPILPLQNHQTKVYENKQTAERIRIGLIFKSYDIVELFAIHFP